MPHATLPSTGLQAVILCGPGESLNPFNSKPEDFPKALVPIANRPMVWYPLDWCYRMGISKIHLITPPECLAALEAALSQNPYLTALPSPKPDVVAPPNISLTTGTAEIFRSEEVQNVIDTDFMVLPCDLVCELSGLNLLETWITTQGILGGRSGMKPTGGPRGGGLCVHYNTKNSPDGPQVGVKKEETDFIAATTIGEQSFAPVPRNSLRRHVRNLAITMPTATLDDVIEEQKTLPIRYALLRKFGRVQTFTTHRDAHIYIFPHWILDMISRNESFENLSEDVLGWWAKAGWQDGLAEKLGLGAIFQRDRRTSKSSRDLKPADVPDLAGLSSTCLEVPHRNAKAGQSEEEAKPLFASRVMDPSAMDSSKASTRNTQKHLEVPQLLTYIHPSEPTGPVIRRVDTAALLLSVSLYLAKIPAQDEATSSKSQHPLAHIHKVHTTTATPQRSTITRADTLIDANVIVAEKTSIKESVVGPNCTIHSGARLTRCLLMDGAVVDEGAVLAGCVIGRRCRIGKRAELKDCFVQEGFVVQDGANIKGETLAGFEEGLDEEFEDTNNALSNDEAEEDLDMIES